MYPSKFDIYVLLLRKSTFSKIECLKSHSLTIPFSDDASIENSLHCITLLFYLSIPVEEIQQRVSLLKSVSMRLELKQGINDCYLIDDTYNNDLAGIEMALDFLAQQPIQKTKTVILSDVLESSMTDEELYKQIGLLLTSRHVERLIGIGDHISMIDACHIVPFSESYDDTITNGIALCPNLHRAFDRGLIAISDDYEVLVKPNFIESDSAFTINQFKNRKILLPSQKEYYPSPENLRQHRNRFNF